MKPSNIRCIFCKEGTCGARSREHIIPESLGNKTQVLPLGTVCDKCNKYFSVKVEGKLLNQPYFKSVRHRMVIESKRGRIPVQNTILISNIKGRATLSHNEHPEMLSLIIEDDNLLNDIINNNPTKLTLLVPMNNEPEKDNVIVSRFLAKIALESLAMRIYKAQGWNNQIVDDKSLDPIRNWARYAKGKKFWNYNQRRTHDENNVKYDPLNDSHYQSLHETGFIKLTPNEVYFVSIIFGIEYAINLISPETDLYRKWLSDNNNKCPLENYTVDNDE